MTEKDVISRFQTAIHKSWNKAHSTPATFVDAFISHTANGDRSLRDAIYHRFRGDFIDALQGSKDNAEEHLGRLARSTKHNAGRKIPLAKANEIFTGFLRRLQDIDKKDEFGVSVPLAFLFGSYLRREEKVGDIDLVVCFERGANWNEKFDEFTNGVPIHKWKGPEMRALRFLKSGSRWLSFHEPDDLLHDEWPFEIIYSRGSGTELAESYRSGSISRADLLRAISRQFH
jgi:hypothetical protein